MPPPDSGKELDQEEKELIARWIEQGASYQGHWSFSTLTRPAIPATEESEGERNTIDVFVDQALQGKGWTRSRAAHRATILRRLTLDLTGLPPTPEQLSRWNGNAPEVHGQEFSLEQVVDELLASPAYGERMAVWWLDLVRYADTVGYHGDQEHHAAAYRDWVIQALKDNVPFDRFSSLQLAGDLITESGEIGQIASAYNRLLQTSHEGGVQVKEYLAKYSADRVRNFSQVWLGVTIGCAECHDHKFDPFSQKEFYQLAACFADIDELQTFKGGDSSPTKRFPEIEVVSPLNRQAKMRVMVSKSVVPRVIRVLPRGNWMDETGEIVSPNFPSALHRWSGEIAPRNRLDLATWLFDRSNPLTARVVVNRLWALFFGRGLAGTLEDHGSQGELPTHPELLDWLACEFIDSGWDIKHIVRLMVLSATYQQTSEANELLLLRDPENRWLARQGALRIPAEFIRDAALQASSLLSHRQGGPPSRPYQPTGYYSHLNFPLRDYVASVGEEQYRRGVYVHWQRQFLHPMLRSFDAPSREECTAQRVTSNTPSQMLVLMNDPTFIECARSLTWNVLEDHLQETADQNQIASDLWMRVLGRQPTEEELALLLEIAQSQMDYYQKHPDKGAEFLSIGQWGVPQHFLDDSKLKVKLAGWSFATRALLMLNETITRY